MHTKFTCTDFLLSDVAVVPGSDQPSRVRTRTVVQVYLFFLPVSRKVLDCLLQSELLWKWEIWANKSLVDAAKRSLHRRSELNWALLTEKTLCKSTTSLLFKPAMAKLTLFA